MFFVDSRIFLHIMFIVDIHVLKCFGQSIAEYSKTILA